ncbi:MobH family relaxase (plasmid) [Xanthomonas sp. NCPPB 3583]|uniref:MobH family relaxase n=1 Tax=Xanthomonas sp. NCPPB 3583 TaxID=487558 RepID=UPI003558355D
MWLSRLFGSISKAEPSAPAEKMPQAEETGEAPPSPADTHQVNTAAIVHRAQVPPAGPSYAGQPVPFYPNREEAVPSAPPDVLLETQGALVQKLHQASGFSYGDFDRYLRPVLRSYAEFVHLLPASENHHHWDIGGLLRHGLECGYHAARRCEAAVFALDFTPAQRKALEPRYRMCAILGALMHDLGKPLFDVGAVDESGKLQWDPHVLALHAWLTENKLPHYFITWRHAPRGTKHEAFTTAAIYRIVPEETLRWIAAAGSQKPFSEMLLAMTSRHDPSNPLVDIIKLADQISVSRDILASRSRLAQTGQGGLRSVASRLVRSLHDKILSGEWRLNRVGDPVWYTDDGIIAVFPEITHRMVQSLRDSGEQGVVHDSMQVLEILADYGFTQPNILPDGRAMHTWHATIDGEDRGKQFSQRLQVIRFHTETIIPSVTVMPTPVKVTWEPAPGQKAVSAPALPAAATTKAEEEATDQAHVEELKQAPIVLASGELPAKPSLADAGTSNTVPSAPAVPPQELKATQDGHAASYPHLYPADMLKDVAVPERVGGDASDPVLPPAQELTGPGELAIKEAPSGADDPDHPYFRDRSTEKDSRTEQMREARELMRSNWPPATEEEANEWLSAKRPMGIYLQDIATAMKANKLRLGEHIFLLDERVNLKFPLVFEGLGADVYELRTELSEIGWIERDPSTPARVNVSITHPRTSRPVECIRLNEDMSQVFQLVAASAFVSPVEKEEPASAPTTIGPYLTADDIGKWTAMSFAGTGDPEQAAVLRNAVYRFFKDRHAPTEDTLDNLVDLDERLTKVTITDFLGAHRGISRTAVHNKCADKANPLFVITQFPNAAAARWELRINPAYSAQQDAEMATLVRDRIYRENNP